MKIYLAGPYSHPDRKIRLERVKALNRKAAELMNQGHIVYSPISMTHPIAEQNELPLGWEYWQQQDRAFIEWADAVYVLKLAGYEESEGVKAEKEIAESMGKMIVEVCP